MIEELRVSLFAQTMGTPVPVSERRIMTAIEHLPLTTVCHSKPLGVSSFHVLPQVLGSAFK